MPPRTQTHSHAPTSRPGHLASQGLVTVTLSALGALAGCKSVTDTPSPGPTTMNTPTGNMRSGIPQTMPVETTAAPGPTTAPHLPTVMGTESRELAVAVSATRPAAPAAPAIPAPAPTHVLTADQPYFSEPPAPGATPAGTLKAGSKVLMVIPGVPYSQVTTADGTSVYTVTDGLKPVGEK